MRLVVLVLGALLLATPARADGDLFGAANEDFAAERYKAAIVKYEELVKDGLKHEDLYYNLGNAYYRDGQLGRAVLYYEKALKIAPGFDDAEFNLKVAREAVAERYGKDTVKGTGRESTLDRMADWVPYRTLAYGILALDLLFFGILIALRFLPTGFLRTGLIVGAAFSGLALGGLAALARVQNEARRVRHSVVVADEVTMREGADSTRKKLFVLHAGHKVRLLEEKHGWVRVRLSNGGEGWLPKESVELI